MRIEDRLEPAWSPDAPRASARGRLLRRLDGLMVAVVAIAGTGLAAAGTYALVIPRHGSAVTEGAETRLATQAPDPASRPQGEGSPQGRDVSKQDRLAVAPPPHRPSSDVAVEMALVSGGSWSPIREAALVAAAARLPGGSAQPPTNVALDVAPTRSAEIRPAPPAGPEPSFQPSREADRARRVAEVSRPGQGFRSDRGFRADPVPTSDPAPQIALAEAMPPAKLEDKISRSPPPSSPMSSEPSPARPVSEPPDSSVSRAAAPDGPLPTPASSLAASETIEARGFDPANPEPEKPRPGSPDPWSPGVGDAPGGPNRSRESTAMAVVTGAPPNRPDPSLREAHQAVSPPPAPDPDGSPATSGAARSLAGTGEAARTDPAVASLEMPAQPPPLPPTPPLAAPQVRPRIVVVRPLGASPVGTKAVTALATSAGWMVVGVRYVQQPVPALAFKSPSASDSVVALKNRLSAALQVPRGLVSLSVAPVAVAEVWVPDDVRARETRSSLRTVPAPARPAPLAPAKPFATIPAAPGSLPSILRPTGASGEL